MGEGPGVRGFVYSLAVPFRPLSALSGRRWWKGWLVLLGIVAALALAVRTVPAMRTASLVTGRAQWIWREMDRRDIHPTAFYAIRDFGVAAPPKTARLLITADEEYVATLNGKRIAAGTCFRRGSGTLLDSYEVGPFLRPGGNRLVVEVRSGRGTGGLLAALRSGETELVVTDESWRIFLRHELGLVRGWLPLGDAGEPAFCWGYPPIGRWGRPRIGSPALLLPRTPPVPAAAVLPMPFLLAGRESGRPPGSPMLYDWGREVEGYLTLDLPPSNEQGTGLLYMGNEPPDLRSGRFTAPILIQAGRHDWLDAYPRRFRYVVMVGLARPLRAAVLPAPARPATRDPEDLEVYGIEGPPLRTPVEDEVWSKLQSLAGVARREEL